MHRIIICKYFNIPHWECILSPTKALCSAWKNLVAKRTNDSDIHFKEALISPKSFFLAPHPLFLFISTHRPYAWKRNFLLSLIIDFSHLLCSIREIYFCFLKSYSVSYTKRNITSVKNIKTIENLLLFSSVPINVNALYFYPTVGKLTNAVNVAL